MVFQLTSHYNLAWDSIAYFRHVLLLFKKRAMANGIYNEFHIIVWHGMAETNLINKILQCVVITDAVTTIKRKNLFDTNQSKKRIVIMSCRIQHKKNGVANILG